MKNNLRLLVATAGLALATVSQAAIISFQWTGTLTSSGLTQTITSATVDNNTPVDFNIGSVTYSYSQTTPFSDGSGTIGLLGDPLSTINFTFSGNADPEGMNAYVMSFNGGTGAFAGYQGNGVLSHTNNEFGTNMPGGQFDAEINPVPEPASLAVLGLGVLGLVRRSRRNAL